MGGYSLKESEETSKSAVAVRYIKSDDISSDENHSHTNGSDEPLESKKEAKMVGVFEVFRFASTTDRLLMLLGTIAACATGAARPMMTILFGNIANTFIDDDLSGQQIEWIIANLSATIPEFQNVTNVDDLIDMLRLYNLTDWADMIEDTTGDGLVTSMTSNSLYYVYMGCAILVVAYVQIAAWRIASYNQSVRIRTSLLRSILRQDISWFDTHEVGQLGSRLVDDVNKIEDGIGEKVAIFFQYMSIFVAGYIVGFIYGWKLTLVVVAVCPLLFLSGGIAGKLMTSMSRKELQAYAKAGAVAEEVLSSMRTVAAFGGEKKESKRYSANLVAAQAFGMKKGLATGVGFGIVFLVMYGSYALAFWYGSTLIREGEYTPGDMLIVFFSALLGSLSFGVVSPNIQDFASARGAAFTVFSIIDLVPSIDSSSTEGVQPEKLEGNVQFKNIHFRYPSRPNIQILNGFNLTVNSGQTVALVGSSGCGKSTCVQLLQRFYDPLEGQIIVDGRDLKEYNLKWLRQHIGVVSQEPILFATTIVENIRYGKDGVTMEEIEKATKEANAYDFIMKLPDKFETLVGERGAQLSGGQKQRIAIARALVRDPVILLLDEATSALDTESEGIVQSALDKARQGRSTIVIAHRLSTIQTADVIAGVNDGKIVEQGTHEELMKTEGIYFTLVTNQKQTKKAEEDGETTETADKALQKTFERSTSRHSARKSVRSRTTSLSDQSHGSTHEGEDEEAEGASDTSMMRIMKLNASEWHFILIGCSCSMIMGFIQIAFAVVFSEILGIFSITDIEEQKKQVNIMCIVFVCIGVVACLSNLGMHSMLTRSGEYMTTRLRLQAFDSMMRQDMAYFDDHINGTGALCSRLATDAAAVKGATGSRLATLIQSIASVGAALTIGFVFSWALTLVVLAFAPFMLFGTFFRMRMFAGVKGKKNEQLEQAAKLASEAIVNIRTVANLTREEKFYKIYSDLVEQPYKTSRKKAHFTGLAYSFSQSITYFCYGGSFAFGAYLVQEHGLHYEDLFRVLTAVMFGATAAGQATSLAPDYGKAKNAAARLFTLFDRVPAIDSSSTSGNKLESVSGSVDLRDLRFNYPTRPDVPVLKGVSLSVQPGQMVALVGSSGCGKSTVIQLLERFYDPASGHVMLDGHKTQSLNIQWLRSQIGIVSQEPILFDCSIRENIAYGDNTREVSMDEIINAARQSNIHSFIKTLPQGYETNVGDKGAQLSGGQKQRVAIARALIRNPKILLLDEATSALDTESEKVVQEALERAQEGRTSIVIAHRLSTIKNADRIVVIHNGLVAEVGTHNDLMNAQGYYYRLNTKQARKRQETEGENPPKYEELN